MQGLSTIEASRTFHKSEERKMSTFRELRDEANLTILELAVLADVSISTINRLEMERKEEEEPLVTRRIARRVLDKLGDHLGRKISLEEVKGLKVK